MMKIPVQFIKFCIVGSIGGVITLGVLYGLTEFLNIWYMISAGIAFTLAVSNNFVLNKYWTFKDSTPKIYHQFVIFFVINVTSLVINLSVLYVITEFMEIWYVKAQIAAILVALSNNYLGNKKFTFNTMD
ncbi:MAG: GtrA family protein [Candidatus Methanofastidiosia archaeon]